MGKKVSGTFSQEPILFQKIDEKSFLFIYKAIYLVIPIFLYISYI